MSKEALFAIDPESAFYANGPEVGKDEISCCSVISGGIVATE